MLVDIVRISWIIQLVLSTTRTTTQDLTTEAVNNCVLGDTLSGRYRDCQDRLNMVYSGRYYAEFLKAPTERTLNMICSRYQAWLLCIQSLAAECNEDMENVLDLAPHTRRRISDICIQEKQEVIRNLECFLTQRWDENVLFRGCYNLLQLRLDAHVYGKCSVVVEYVRCEDTLIRSACGSTAADFRLALTLETKLRDYVGDDEECHYTPASAESALTGYAYSLNCPPEFPVVVKSCFQSFKKKYLMMNHRLMAVVKSTHHEYRQYCEAYRQYRECIEPVESMCPGGLLQLYDVVPEWKHRLAVADYLCTVYKDYTASWSCYQSAARTDFIMWCKQLYDELPTRTEAYVIKCTHQTNSHSHQRLKKRDGLIDCYQSFIQRRCGSNASRVISPLIQLHYSFDHLPPCHGEARTDCACASGAAYSGATTAVITNCYFTIKLFIIITVTVLLVYPRTRSKRE